MKHVLTACAVVLLMAGCTSSQFALYRPVDSNKQWHITANKAPISGEITVAVNDSAVVVKTPGLFSTSFDAKGVYEGREVKVYGVYNHGFLNIGEGWETSVFVDNELAAKFKL